MSSSATTEMITTNTMDNELERNNNNNNNTSNDNSKGVSNNLVDSEFRVPRTQSTQSDAAPPNGKEETFIRMLRCNSPYIEHFMLSADTNGKIHVFTNHTNDEKFCYAYHHYIHARNHEKYNARMNRANNNNNRNRNRNRENNHSYEKIKMTKRTISINN